MGVGVKRQKEGLKANISKKIVLVVDDDQTLSNQLISILFSHYIDAVEMKWVKNAGDALKLIEFRKSYRRPDAILLDLMMPYGPARQKLDKDYTDPDDTETGIRLLEYLRRVEKEAGLDPVWVAIITARSPFALNSIGKGLLESRCKVYFKPFDTFQLESDLMTELGVPSNIPSDLLLPMDNNSEINGNEEI
jgi:CheY-like chemotaxis protein